MQVFKCALKLVLRNPLFLLIYTVALSFMGAAMAMGATSSQPASLDVPDAHYVSFAVIDRDKGDVSVALEEFLDTRGTRVQVNDQDVALQDAVAKGQVDFILMVPEGWSHRFVQVAASGEEGALDALPKMESVYSFYSAEGALMDAEVANFTGLLAASIAADPAAAPDQWIKSALDAAASRAQVGVVAPEGTSAESPAFTFYLQFSIYSLFASIVVCISILLSTLNRTDVRRRNLSSPVSWASCNVQIILACLVVTLFICAWILGLGMVCFGDSVQQLGPARVAQMAGTVVVFSLVPLGLGCLLGQMGVGGTAANGFGNIVALVLSFLGGAWIPLAIAPEVVRVVSRFLPGYWYTDALVAGDFSQVAAHWAVLLLFAAALFAASLVVARARTQTAE